jgi:prephenate dehydrogenase
MTVGHVRIVGTGLIGTSLGLALRRLDVTVSLADPSPTAVALARDLGAGELAERVAAAPDLVVVAAPPDVTAAVVADELRHWRDCVVTDVASVKGSVLEALRATGVPLDRYVGSHPMAGRERSGAVAAEADLFEGRTWVVVPGPESTPAAVELVTGVAASVGAAPVRLAPGEHDEAVAAVSHVPQIVASLVAGRLRDLPARAVALSGQGIRDVTRIAASDPLLWTQILAANAPAVRQVLVALAADLAETVAALADLAPGSRATLARMVAHGNTGHARIPGKHGAEPTAYATVLVVVPDEPGALGRLFQDMGDAGINLEDLRLEHGVGAPFGIAELAVLPAVGERLEDELLARGWRVHT